jgi:hypothetical protein
MYRNYSGDLQGDAEHFFKNSSGAVEGLSLLEISLISEGSLAIFIWSSVFNIMEILGFPRDQYIGVMVNVLFMSFNAVLLFKITRLLFGVDPSRFKRMLLFTSTCGLLWIFSGILQRDSLVLLSVNLLLYTWLKFLTKPGFNFDLFYLTFGSFLAFISFGFLRAEFSFVPIAFAASGLVSVLVCTKKSNKIISIIFLLPIVLILINFFLLDYGSKLHLTLLRAYESYSTSFSTTNSKDSLGMTLIVNQPTPLRLLFGSVYLYVFPIPFWSGFQLNTVYHLFKSFNVIYFYFMIPLLFLSIRTLYMDRSRRTPQLMFCLFVVVGFTLAIAGTSLETRHIGAFFGPVFILGLIPNLSVRNVWHNYCQFLSTTLICVFSIHLVWLALKLI